MQNDKIKKSHIYLFNFKLKNEKNFFYFNHIIYIHKKIILFFRKYNRYKILHESNLFLQWYTYNNK